MRKSARYGQRRIFMDRIFNQDIQANNVTAKKITAGEITATLLSETLLHDLIDLFLPVGHYIETERESFNPNTLYPNTAWVKERGYFHISESEDYAAGSTGGEANHTLTIEEIPNHNHTVYGYVYSNDFGESTVVPNRTIVFQNHNGVEVDFGGGVSRDNTSHNLSITDTENTGGSQPHNNMPPYIAVYRWKRTA